MKPIEELAKEAAGNWKKFPDFFCEMDDWEEPDSVYTTYTSNRDSEILDQSNETEILKEMKPFIDKGTVKTIRHNHWACGYVDGLEILVFKKGKITTAFKKWYQIQERLENYPVLDEDNYNEREYIATLEGIESATYKYDKDGWDTHWAAHVYEYLSEHHPESVENRDGKGGYPSDAHLQEALESLGFIEKELA